MTHLDTDLERLGDALRASAAADLAREARAARSSGTPSRSGRTRLLRRPRVLAGSSLGLAGVGAALVLALSAGGAAAPTAFAITRSNDGLLVNLSYVGGQTISQVNQKLAAMGTNERFSIQMATGPAPVAGPVTCTRAPGVSGPAVKALVGKDGTDVIGSGQSAGNTAEGTFHMVACYLSSDSATGNSGASGNS